MGVLEERGRTKADVAVLKRNYLRYLWSVSKTRFALHRRGWACSWFLIYTCHCTRFVAWQRRWWRRDCGASKYSSMERTNVQVEWLRIKMEMGVSVRGRGWRPSIVCCCFSGWMGTRGGMRGAERRVAGGEPVCLAERAGRHHVLSHGRPCGRPLRAGCRPASMCSQCSQCSARRLIDSQG